MKRLAIFVSGSGTNMQSIIDAVENGSINAKVVLVISSNPCAKALERADKHGIDNYVCALADFNSKEDRDKRILELLDSYRVDFVVLAGYLGILSSFVVEKFNRRIINVHPSLLPKYGGKGFYGINVHNAVLDAVIKAGETETGVTIHFVDSGIDTGDIISQRKLNIISGETADELQKRVLAMEHRLLVDVLCDLCSD